MPGFAQALLAPLGTIIAALIAALFSFVGLIIAKENKVSEFRQAWVESLRDELSTYSASVTSLAHAESIWHADDSNAVGWQDYLGRVQPTYEAALKAQMFLRLRVNRSDRDRRLKRSNSDLLQTLDRIQALINERKFDDGAELAKTLHVQAIPILELQWRRVRQGEPIYLAAKWIVGTFVVIALTLVLYYTVTQIQHRAAPAASTPALT